MKKINLVVALLVMLAVSLNLLSLRVFSQTSALDTYTITLSNKDGKTSLNSPTTALNITVAPGGQGVSGLDTGVSFKANGAIGLLTDVNLTKNLITVVWSGGISDGKATITGKLKQGNTVAPNFTVVKIEKDGGVDVTADLNIKVELSSSSTSQSSSSSSGAVSSTSSSSGGTTTSSSGGPIMASAEPGVTLNGPDQFVVKRTGLNTFKLKVKGTNFKSATKCTISVSDDSLLRVRPKRFTLSPQRSSGSLLAKVPLSTARGIIDNDSSEIVDVDVDCSNDTSDTLEIELAPSSGP